MPPEAEPQEKLNALTESQRLSARTAAKAALKAPFYLSKLLG